MSMLGCAAVPQLVVRVRSCAEHRLHEPSPATACAGKSARTEGAAFTATWQAVIRWAAGINNDGSNICCAGAFAADSHPKDSVEHQGLQVLLQVPAVVTANRQHAWIVCSSCITRCAWQRSAPAAFQGPNGWSVTFQTGGLMRRILRYAVTSPLVVLALWLTRTEAVADQGATCSSPFGGSCSSHVDFACSDCWLFNWNWYYMWEKSAEGTRIVHCTCDDGYSTEVWYNAPCGQCGMNGSGGS